MAADGTTRYCHHITSSNLLDFKWRDWIVSDGERFTRHIHPGPAPPTPCDAAEMQTKA
jgi:hypothetical protein